MPLALTLLRLRRAVALSSAVLQHHPVSSSYSFVLPNPPASSLSVPNPSSNPIFQARSFRSTAPAANRRWDVGEDDKIKPDEILFEGCDYNHWLITMDFPKDPKPTPEEMVETYVQTAAQVLGSVEEAKKKIYACSTTTYHGFQVEVSEEVSEKFKGLPGVVFVLPDSYIDPVNKQYGGDKYDNGVITPRPPPIQYGRQGRFGDRNRNYDRPRFDRPRDSGPNQPYDRQGLRQNYNPQQNYPAQQNYGPSSDRRDFGPPSGVGYGPGGGDGRQGVGRDPVPPYPNQQGNFAQGGSPWGQPGDQRYADYRQGSGPGYSGGYRQGSGPGYVGEHGQGSGPGYSGRYRQGSGPEYDRDHRQGLGPGYSGDFRQGSGPGYNGGIGYGGDNTKRTGPGYGGDNREEPGPGYGQN